MQYDVGEIRQKAEPIFKRVSELNDRPEAVNKARKILTDVKNTVVSWEDKMPWVTSEEKEKLLELVTKASSWIDEKEEAQKKVGSYFLLCYTSSLYDEYVDE